MNRSDAPKPPGAGFGVASSPSDPATPAVVRRSSNTRSRTSSRAETATVAAADSGLARLVAEARIVLCCGPGGVGKTTTAATLALHAARSGRRAVVVTIDPARRLADALGLGSSGLTNDPQRVAIDGAPGELWAMMLDARSTFDAVIRRYAGTGTQAETILANRFYRNISGVLSGTQEYMAAEKLYELHHDDRFDLVVIDTPPTRNALDFLDAPARLTRFLDHRVYRALTAPSRLGLKVLNTATQLFLRPIAKVVGGEVVTDLIDFFQAFDGMEEGFRDRAQQVIGLLRRPESRYVLITSPRREAIAEAEFFAGKLSESGLSTAAIIVNRLHPRFSDDAASVTTIPSAKSGDASQLGRGKRSTRPAASAVSSSPPDTSTLETSALDTPASEATDIGGGAALEAAERNLAELRQVADRERAALGPLIERAGAVPVAEVPLLTGDVHDLAGIGEIAAHLFTVGTTGR